MSLRVRVWWFSGVVTGLSEGDESTVKITATLGRMYPWYRESVAAAAAAGLGGPVGVVGSGFCSTTPGQGATTIKTESGYSDCMLALDYVQSKVSATFCFE